jgi:predicted transcriptional regulator
VAAGDGESEAGEREQLDREWIEARAQAILDALPRSVWDGRTLPVPIDEIVTEELGLLVREMDDLTAAPGCPELGPDQALSALLITSELEIWVNAEEARQWPQRRRFSIAHEVGHWVLHRTGQHSLFCRRTTVDEEAKGAAELRRRRAQRAALPLAEEEANAFASALLMPRDLLRHHYVATGKDFDRLCELFGSSRAAMGRRLHVAVPREG